MELIGDIEFWMKKCAAMNEKLMEAKLEIEEERLQKRNLFRRNFILNKRLQETTKERDFFKQELAEKEEMEAFLELEEVVEEEEASEEEEALEEEASEEEEAGSDSEPEGTDGDGDFHPYYGFKIMPTIPEVDPDEVPGYWDAW